MKKAVKGISILLLYAIYCLSISLACMSFCQSNISEHSPSHFIQKKKQTAASNFFYLIAEESESTKSAYPSNKHPKSFENKFSNVKSQAEHRIKSSAVQYIKLAHTFQIATRKSDLIYPFQYFL